MLNTQGQGPVSLLMQLVVWELASGYGSIHGERNQYNKAASSLPQIGAYSSCTRTHLPWVGVDNASQEVKLPSLPPTASSPCRDHWKEDHSQSSSATQVILRSVISSEVNQCCISLSVPSETLSQIIVVSYCIIRHSYM